MTGKLKIIVENKTFKRWKARSYLLTITLSTVVSAGAIVSFGILRQGQVSLERCVDAYQREAPVGEVDHPLDALDVPVQKPTPDEERHEPAPEDVG